MSGELVARGLTLRSVDEKKRTVDFVASTDAIDSYDEVVEQDWILDRYLANPVVLFGHNSREMPIGKATRTEVVTSNGRQQLECTIQFLTEKANPVAEQVWNSVLEGGLRAVSVGFIPGDYRFEKRNGTEVFVLSKNTLHEISVVPIPANPEALAKMKAKALAAAGHEPKPAATAAETTMNEKEMQERIAKADAARELAEKNLATEHTAHEATKKELSTTQTALKIAEGDRDGFKARAEKAEATGIEAEVDALVGKKITPAEKAEFLELRQSNPKLFERMVAARPEMKLLNGQVIKDDDAKTTTDPVTPPATKADGAELGNKIFGS